MRVYCIIDENIFAIFILFYFGRGNDYIVVIIIYTLHKYLDIIIFKCLSHSLSLFVSLSVCFLYLSMSFYFCCCYRNAKKASLQITVKAKKKKRRKQFKFIRSIKHNTYDHLNITLTYEVISSVFFLFYEILFINNNQ